MHKIEEYMVSQNIQRIAVYGLGVTGETFIKQMEEVKIQIAYIIGVKKTDYNIEVRMLNEVKNDVDLIVVTEENDYPDVYRELISRINIPIVPLSRLLDEVHLTGLYSIDIPAE